MEKVALFPGSFDPITKGHESIVCRSLSLFDKVVVAIGVNAEKHSFFPLERRIEWVRMVFSDDPAVEVITYQGLTVDLCKRLDIRFILRGLRTAVDFEFERSIGQMNKKMYPGLETVFLLTIPEYTALNSSIVRDIIRNGGDASQFIPDGIVLDGAI